MVVRPLVCAAACAALLAGPAAAAAAPPAPTVVAQAQPAGRVLNDVRDIVRLAAGPKHADDALKQFQKWLERQLGEQGLDGIDINRPVGAYATVREKFDESTVVLVLPVTSEKEFVGLLDRLKVTATPVAGKDGLYSLEFAREPFPRPSHLRVANGWAYVGLNGDEVADPANLVPPGELFDAAESAQLAVRLYPDRFPDKLLKQWLDEMDKGAGEAKQFFVGFQDPHVGQAFGVAFDEAPKLIRRWAEGLRKEAKEVTLRLGFDPRSGDYTGELVVTPKPGTAMAKDVAARTPTTNRFAGLVPADAAVGFVGQAPLFSPEARAVWAAFMGTYKGEAHKVADEAVRPLLTELFDGLARAAKAGDGDLAAALLGPDKGGAYTLVAAAAFDDPAKLEKELRALARTPAAKKYLTPDAAKVGDVAVHKVSLGSLIPDEAGGEVMLTALGKLLKSFGPDPAVHVALTPKAVYVAAGPDPVGALTAALAAKPGPAPALGLSGNTARLQKLVEQIGGKEGAKEFAAVFGTSDKRADLFTLTLDGGTTLRLRWVMNVKYIPRAIILAERSDSPPPLPPR
jgi:hypothetical protein